MEKRITPHGEEVLRHSVEIAGKIGFSEAECNLLLPAMKKILLEKEDGFIALEKAVLCREDNKKMVRSLTRSPGLEDDFGMLAVCLLLTHAARQYYNDLGIDEEIYLASMRDIRVWATTCMENRGRLGLYEYGWIREFFTASIVRLGRLEFHEITYDLDEPYTACGVTVKKGDTVINTHIPADGPLLPEEVEDAFRRAYRYFGKSEIAPIVCHSWLLYPKNRLFCPAGSRIVSFLDCFTILKSEDHPKSGNLWRVFGEGDFSDYNTLPEKTPLQRGLKAHLLSGGTMGEGYGILLHDGEHRVDKG